MSEEQLRLIAQILNTLCNEYAILPYYEYGANMGQCRYCGTKGIVKYPDVIYDHREDCIIALNDKLQQSLEEKKDDRKQ